MLDAGCRRVEFHDQVRASHFLALRGELLTRRHREAKQATSRSTRSSLRAAPPERGCVAPAIQEGLLASHSTAKKISAIFSHFKRSSHECRRANQRGSVRSEEHTSELQSLMRS